MRELALFAGAGGGILGGHLLGWRTVCAVELDAYCRSALLARQRDGYLQRFPIWDDVRTFDGRPWRGSVDVITGGFPCQDISSAGKRMGINGPRSGLWSEMRRVIDEVRPAFVFAENSPHLRTRGLGTVIKDLADLGYHVRWGSLGDCHAGGATIGARMWVVGEAHDSRKRASTVNAKVGGAPEPSSMATASNRLAIRVQQRRRGWENGQAKAQLRDDARSDEARRAGTHHGLAHRVDRVKATGNGQVASLAAVAWTIMRAGVE